MNTYTFSIKTPGIVEICIGKIEKQSFSRRTLKDKLMRMKVSRQLFRSEAEYIGQLNMLRKALDFLESKE